MVASSIANLKEERSLKGDNLCMMHSTYMKFCPMFPLPEGVLHKFQRDMSQFIQNLGNFPNIHVLVTSGDHYEEFYLHNKF